MAQRRDDDNGDESRAARLARIQEITDQLQEEVAPFRWSAAGRVEDCVPWLQDKWERLRDGRATELYLGWRFLLTLLALWRSPLRSFVEEGFLRALPLLCHTMSSITLEPVAKRETDLELYAALGAALASLPALTEVTLRQRRLRYAGRAAAAVLRALPRIPHLWWVLLEPEDAAAVPRDDAFSHLQAALSRNGATIESVLLRYGVGSTPPGHRSSDLLSKIFHLLSICPALTRLTLVNCVVDRNVPRLSPLLALQSLKDLKLCIVEELSWTAATALCRTIGATQIQSLKISESPSLVADDSWPADAVAPLTLALAAPALHAFEVMDLPSDTGPPFILHSRDSSLALAGALERAQLQHFYVPEAAWHEDVSKDMAKALCQPALRSLGMHVVPYNDMDEPTDGTEFMVELGESIHQCPLLKELLVTIDQTFDGAFLVEFLSKIAQCSELTKIDLPMFHEWTVELDNALAKFVSTHPKLKVLHMVLWDADGQLPLRRPTAPALLAACRVHPAMEYVGDWREGPWCPRYLQEMKQALTPSEKARRFRELFESLATVDGPPGVIASALFHARYQPHLLYEGLTACKGLLMAEPGILRPVPVWAWDKKSKRFVLTFK